MAYNVTKLVNGTSIVEVTQGINDASGGIFAPFLLLIMFIILMIVFKNYETRSALLTAGVIMSFMASIMAVMDLVGWNIVIIPVAIVFVSLMWLALGE